MNFTLKKEKPQVTISQIEVNSFSCKIIKMIIGNTHFRAIKLSRLNLSQSPYKTKAENQEQTKFFSLKKVFQTRTFTGCGSRLQRYGHKTKPKLSLFQTELQTLRRYKTKRENLSKNQQNLQIGLLNPGKNNKQQIISDIKMKLKQKKEKKEDNVLRNENGKKIIKKK